MARPPQHRVAPTRPRGSLSPEAMRRVGMGQFFRDTVAELRRVTWPTREETLRLTWVVLAISIAMGLALGLIDLAFSSLLDAFVIP